MNAFIPALLATRCGRGARNGASSSFGSTTGPPAAMYGVSVAALSAVMNCAPEWIGIADQDEGLAWREII